MNQIFIFLAAITIFSCGKDDKDLLNPVEPKYDLTKVIADPDVAYGSASSNIMDVYLPANRSTTRTKVIVLIHGGAWADAEKYGQRKGDKSDFAAVIDSLRRRMPDWAIFNLNYTLATITGILPPKGNNVFPVQEKDVKKAVQYIYDNRQAFSISDQWVLAGASAGAHLAMLQAYKNYSTIRPKAVVNLFGPVDMTALYN
ncbi:MAG TPA: alpha/beta hydrolase, partial [Niabella sp.]|nr:alpha/beta hydrolase [Niabella sp.]